MTERQLPLLMRFPQGARFERFVADGNEAVIATLRALVVRPIPPGILLIGARGVGKTHLALAVAAAANAVLLPLADLGERALSALESTQAHGLVVIDDVDAIAGQRAAEIALFDLFNRTRATGGALLVTAPGAVPHLPLTLPDLASRLASLSLLVLRPLDETARRRVVREHGTARGLEISEEVLDFLFRRYPRDLGALLNLIDRLDRESLARKRRLTVPLVRQVLRDGD